jgi:hypothetical protein
VSGVNILQEAINEAVMQNDINEAYGLLHLAVWNKKLRMMAVPVYR